MDSGLFVYRKHKDHQGQDRVDRQTAGSLPDWTQLRHELQMTMQVGDWQRGGAEIFD